MKNLFFNTLLNKGAKGSKGNSGQSYKIPEGAIIAYDGIETPEGYEELDIEGRYSTKEVTEIGVYKASDYGLDGFTEFTVNLEVNYNWYYNNDKTLVVREKISDGSFRWYFNHYKVTTASSPFMPIPSNLARFVKNGVTAYCHYREIDEGQIGFYEDSIRLWLSDLTINVPGDNITGIIESSYISVNNPYKWEEPTFDPTNG